MKMHSSHTYPWNDTFFRSLFNSCNKVLNSTSTKSAVSASRWVEGINELLDGKEQFQTRTEKLIPELRNLRDEEIDDVYRYSWPLNTAPLMMFTGTVPLMMFTGTWVNNLGIWIKKFNISAISSHRKNAILRFTRAPIQTPLLALPYGPASKTGQLQPLSGLFSDILLVFMCVVF